MAREVSVRQSEQVGGADQHHELQLNEIDREHDRRDPEGERPNDAISKGLALLALGKPQNEHSQNHGVVRAEQPFQRNEQPDGDEIRRLNVQDRS
jgi:hypothetical protein